MPRPKGQIRPHEGRESGRINRLRGALEALVEAVEHHVEYAPLPTCELTGLVEALRPARGVIGEERTEKPR